MIYPYALTQGALDGLMKLVEKRRNSHGWESLYDMHGWDKAELSSGAEEMDWDDDARSWKVRANRASPAASDVSRAGDPIPA